MKRILLFSFSLLPACLLFSQTGDPANRQEQTAAGSSLPNTLLWKISGKGLKQPSYLFGTMHILCADDARLSDSLKSVIDHCDEVYFEIDLDDAAGMMKSIQYMRMNGSKKLSDLLNAADYAKVKGYFEKHPFLLPFSMLERFKPLLISSLVEEDGLDCKTTNGMELIIMKECQAQNRKINGLETAEFQASLFDSIPYEKQALDLVNYIDSVDMYKKMTADLATVYRHQDLQKIDELTRTGDATVSNYLDLLLYGRNRKWVNSLGTLMPEKSLLIAVGAGHLPGEQGVISLLKEKGYTVSPVKN
jgi:uncharacterized protein YbaP (TraB family)